MATYRHIIANSGLILAGEYVDSGQNHYYAACKGAG